MFDRNQNQVSDTNNKNANDMSTQYTQPIDDNIDPVDFTNYDDNESPLCPFDMYRLDNDGRPMPYANQPIRPHPQPYPPRPIRPQPIWPHPWPYNPNVHYIIHHHHHFYHNRPNDGR